MTVPDSTSEVFVWAWLPGSPTPVPCGVLRPAGSVWRFAYGSGYLDRPDAVSLSPDLPLGPDWFAPAADLPIPGALRDAAPDWWGRQVVMRRLTGAHGPSSETGMLPESVYLLESASDRFGAIDYQTSPTAYVPRGEDASVDELLAAADRIQSGQQLSPDLAAAALQGTSMGGARPKATLVDAEGASWIAKFPTSTDPLPVVRGEAACLALARAAGIDVPDSRIVTSLGKDVLLVRRFDRPAGGTRRMCVSGLTLLQLGEMTARYGTYPELLDVLGHSAADPGAIGEEVFRRIAFNMAVSNTDDHLRNHAAFWDGARLSLTPAFDLAPAPRSGETAYQALAYGRDGERESSLAGLVACAHVYGLSRREAVMSVDRLVDAIHAHWDDAADAARLTRSERDMLWGHHLLNQGTTRGLRHVAAPDLSPAGADVAVPGFDIDSIARGHTDLGLGV